MHLWKVLLAEEPDNNRKIVQYGLPFQASEYEQKPLGFSHSIPLKAIIQDRFLQK